MVSDKGVGMIGFVKLHDSENLNAEIYSFVKGHGKFHSVVSLFLPFLVSSLYTYAPLLL